MRKFKLAQSLIDRAQARADKLPLLNNSIRKGEGRGIGTDAIRVVIVDEDGKVCNNSFKRVHRTKNWRLNLLKRYEPIIEHPQEYAPIE